MTFSAPSDRIVFRGVLSATDFSAISQAALEYAAAVAKHYGAKLYVAYVTRPRRQSRDICGDWCHRTLPSGRTKSTGLTSGIRWTESSGLPEIVKLI
jgi:hypothetical protein